MPAKRNFHSRGLGKHVTSPVKERYRAQGGSKKRRTQPDGTAYTLYENWSELLPTLVEPFLQYIKRSHRSKSNYLASKLIGTCKASCNVQKLSVTCLYFNCILVRNGLFPTAPCQLRMAVSIDLLEFYQALFERSCDAVQAMAAALNTFYTRRGFILLSKKGDIVRDAFRRGLGYAIQWYDNLQRRVEKTVDKTVDFCAQQIRAVLAKSPEKLAASSGMSSSLDSGADVASSLQAGSCNRILQQRCPACFGGGMYGRSLSRGADFHNCVDGNFHHRHIKAAGQCPKFFDPEYMLPKEFVDSVGTRIEAARRSRPKAYQPIVPDEAVNECEESHEAADMKKQKATMERFDDTGLMFLVCRHDIPLFCTNIDTPGEHQKYAVALLEHFFSLIPPHATVATLYDIGCVLDRSLSLYDILPEHITRRLLFATSAMHAYGHQWSCQLHYNPRLREGLGLTDGEGVERLWSRLRKIIGITRTSAQNKRVWLIDRQANAIGTELRDDLGLWLWHRMTKNIEKQEITAQSALEECGVSAKELRKQWHMQREAQMSIRAHAPMKLRKELDSVLILQGDLDTLEKAIETSREIIERSPTFPETRSSLQNLTQTHETLRNHVENLYASLNIPEQFPNVQGLDLEFLRTLLMARDLKINIRKRAIGSFFEWDRLDQAVGGRQQILGTRLHQTTRKAMAKRKPALLAAIRKFNTYCEKLDSLYQVGTSVPLPKPLPVHLGELKNCPHLMEDVWISPSTGPIPRWLDDENVRQGIRALLKLDRCAEERCRLQLEASNLCNWLAQELSSLELGIRISEHDTYSRLLLQRRDHLSQLKASWASFVLPLTKMEEAISEFAHTAEEPCRTLNLPLSNNLESEILAEHLNIVDDLLPLEMPTQDSVFLNTDDATVTHILSADLDEDDLDTDSEDVDAEVTSENPTVRLLWAVPEGLTYDSQLFSVLQSEALRNTVSSINGNHSRIFRWLGYTHYFDAREMGILSTESACLNDVCVNGGAALFQSIFDTNSKFALLSTFDLPRIRYHATDQNVWRNIRHSLYWEKNIWVLPIHRSNPVGHWVLCVINIATKQLSLFDSLAGRAPWKSELNVIMQLISRFVVLARKHGGSSLHVEMDGWVAQPITTWAFQTNGHDCGLWVLAILGAVLQGFDSTGLCESDMARFRHILYHRILALPQDK
ncbi:hypothetical protein JOM56_012733 [Amanita muscaria]